ncbi:hypothetical protein GCM10023159_11260 [Brevibacterium yomogidense]
MSSTVDLNRGYVVWEPSSSLMHPSMGTATDTGKAPEAGDRGPGVWNRAHENRGRNAAEARDPAGTSGTGCLRGPISE